MLNFDPNLKIPLLAGQKPPELCSKYIFIQNWSNICTHICKKTWRAGRRSLKFGVLGNQVVLRKTLENKNFLRPALLCANIYQIFFSHLDTWTYLLLFFQESVQMVPSLYHILQQGCQNSNWFLYCWDGVSTRTQIFERKWNWQNMFTQIFLSEIISTAENGGQGTHFLISQILKGLTHSALSR